MTTETDPPEPADHETPTEASEPEDKKRRLFAMRVDADVLDSLEALAKDFGVPMSAVGRRALKIGIDLITTNPAQMSRRAEHATSEE